MTIKVSVQLNEFKGQGWEVLVDQFGFIRNVFIDGLMYMPAEGLEHASDIKEFLKSQWTHNNAESLENDDEEVTVRS